MSSRIGFDIKAMSGRQKKHGKEKQHGSEG